MGISEIEKYARNLPYTSYFNRLKTLFQLILSEVPVREKDSKSEIDFMETFLSALNTMHLKAAGKVYMELTGPSELLQD